MVLLSYLMLLNACSNFFFVLQILIKDDLLVFCEDINDSYEIHTSLV